MRLSSLAIGLLVGAAERSLAQTAKDGTPASATILPALPVDLSTFIPPMATPARGTENVGRFTFSFSGLEEPVTHPRALVAGKSGQSLSWSSSDKVVPVVELVELYNSSRQVFASGRPQNKGTQKLDKKQQADTAPLTVTGSAVEFDINQRLDAWSLNTNKAVYANVTWRGASEMGSTWTSPFVILRNPGDMESAESLLQVDAGSLPAPSESTGPLPTSTTSNPTSATTTTSNSSAPVSSGGGGLSAGVIAGIAVGGAAALAIVGVLVWFFCFRRRKQHGQVRNAEYGHDAGTHAMIVDKEVPGVSTSSPHSAYGDDGGRLHDRSSTAMDSSYAPYSDHGPSAHASPAVGHATATVQPSVPRGTSSPAPQPATTQYAHLVEEGMTADEIRRLEEEERALDQAIEAAGTNRPGR